MRASITLPPNYKSLTTLVGSRLFFRTLRLPRTMQYEALVRYKHETNDYSTIITSSLSTDITTTE